MGRSGLTRWWVAMALLQVLSSSEPLWAQPAQQPRVLTLYSTRRDARIVDVGDRDLPRLIERGIGGTIDYYSEFIDQARFGQSDYHDAVRAFLRVKYEMQAFDLVIVVDDTALQFVVESRAELFSHAPVVYFSSTSDHERLPNSTGVVSVLNFADSVEMALQMQPQTQHLFVISGSAGPNLAFDQAARSQLARFSSRLDVTFLTGLVTDDLLRRLASLPEHSIVQYVIVDRDGAAQYSRPLDYLDRVVTAANAPVYSWVDSTIGMGVVGGSLKSQTAEMKALGSLAIRVLKGEPADSIPVASTDLNIKTVDWRQIQRWGISESRLPEGTAIQFREPSAWDRYKEEIVAAILLLAAQSALIATLLVQRSRRRQAEVGLMASQTRLRASYSTISDLGRRLLVAHESERSHIARELHDDVGQQIALLASDLQKLSGDGHDARRERDLDVALGHVSSLSKSVHDLSHSLHPTKLRMLGLRAALDGLKREMAGPEFHVAITYDNVPALPEDLTLCVFRVVQEALQNAMKHSRAKGVNVHLNGGPSFLAVDIVDDGLGFDVQNKFGQGLGLISMNERLEALGGSLTIHSAPGAGTRLKIQVPFASARAVKSIAV